MNIAEVGMFCRTENALFNARLGTKEFMRLRSKICSVEAVEFLQDEEIREMLKILPDYYVEDFMKILEDFRKKDAENTREELSYWDAYEIFDAITKFWVAHEAFENLKKIGLSTKEINYLVFKVQHPGVLTLDEMEIHHLGLSSRANNALRWGGVKTVADAIQVRNRIKDFDNVGPKLLEEIFEGLDSIESWRMKKPTKKISNERKIELVNKVLGIVGDGKDRRYFRAFLKDVGLSDEQVSTLVNQAFPRESKQETVVC